MAPGSKKESSDAAAEIRYLLGGAETAKRDRLARERRREDMEEDLREEWMRIGRQRGFFWGFAVGASSAVAVIIIVAAARSLLWAMAGH